MNWIKRPVSEVRFICRHAFLFAFIDSNHVRMFLMGHLKKYQNFYEMMMKKSQ